MLIAQRNIKITVKLLLSSLLVVFVLVYCPELRSGQPKFKLVWCCLNFVHCLIYKVQSLALFSLA